MVVGLHGRHPSSVIPYRGQSKSHIFIFNWLGWNYKNSDSSFKGLTASANARRRSIMKFPSEIEAEMKAGCGTRGAESLGFVYWASNEEIPRHARRIATQADDGAGQAVTE